MLSLEFVANEILVLLKLNLPVIGFVFSLLRKLPGYSSACLWEDRAGTQATLILSPPHSRIFLSAF